MTAVMGNSIPRSRTARSAPDAIAKLTRPRRRCKPGHDEPFATGKLLLGWETRRYSGALAAVTGILDRHGCVIRKNT